MTRFPLEARGLHLYFRDVRRAARWHVQHGLSRSLPPFIGIWLRILSLTTRRLALRTTARYLERRFQDPKLQALLATQWGDYGVPPESSAFARNVPCLKNRT